MGNKISIQDMAQILSASSDLSRKDNELYIKAFFDTIREGLLEFKLVKIKGFGTFKLIEVLDRESINVNTGERIVIPGHSKVSFTPDAELKDQVNKPFAFFQTVIINERTPLEEMEKIDTSVSLPVPDVSPFESTQNHSADKSVEYVESNVEVNSDNTEIVDSSEDNNENVLPVLSESTNTNIVEEMLENVSSESSVLSPEPSVSEYEEIHGTNLPDVKPLTTHCTKEEEADVSVDTIQSQENEDFSSSHASEAMSTTCRESLQINTPVSDVLPHKRWCICPPLIYYVICFNLVLIILSYCAGYYRWFIPEDKKIETPAVVDTSKQVTVKPKAQSPKLNDTPKEDVKSEKEVEDLSGVYAQYAQVPGGTHLIVGTLEERQISKGDYLYKIARDVYGDKDFAKYIIVHNQFPNPDNIPLGTIVKLPKLQKIK